MLSALLVCTLVACAEPAAHATPARAPHAAPVSRVRDGGPIPLADSIVVEKKERRLTLYHQGRRLRSYLVALGGNPVGDKREAGDRRTPEGLFWIEGRDPWSSFNLSLRISYPDAAHRARAEALGLSPGGDIAIHGLPLGKSSTGAYHRTVDWTDGCIALTDEEIAEIWSAVSVGTPVQIKP